MKKLMVMACAIAMAAVAQAVAVNWTIGYIEGAGAGGKGWSGEALSGAGITAQLIVGTTYSNGEIGGLITDFNTLTTSGAEEGYMFGYSTSAAQMALDTPYYMQVVLTDGNSTLKSLVGTSTATAYTGNEATPVFAFTRELGYLTPAAGVTFDPQYGAFSSAGWQTVPEPTSGLLLLLGVAGLALRRRRA